MWYYMPIFNYEEQTELRKRVKQKKRRRLNGLPTTLLKLLSQKVNSINFSEKRLQSETNPLDFTKNMMEVQFYQLCRVNVNGLFFILDLMTWLISTWNFQVSIIIFCHINIQGTSSVPIASHLEQKQHKDAIFCL